jgi:threonine dehydratase
MQRIVPDVPVDLDVDRIARAAQMIDPVFRDSPQFVDEQLCAALGRQVLVKVETQNPLHSFKGRGAEWFAEQLEQGRRVICASSGNFGQAMAYACRRRGIPVEVFVPADVNPVKAARMRALVDDLVLVPDAALIDMMRLAADTLGILLEPSGAAGLAAIATHDLPGERLATILTGSNPHPQLLAAILTGDRP